MCIMCRLTDWIRSHRRTCKIILATSLAWTSIVHLILFLVLQSELLPLCIFYGSEVHCEGLKLFKRHSPHQEDHSKQLVLVNGSNGDNKAVPLEYAEFFTTLHTQHGGDKEVLAAFQQVVPDYPLQNLTFWYWSKYPGGSPPAHKDPASKVKPRLGDRGERIYLQGQAKNESEFRFSEHQFDVVISDMISVNRSLPDVRSLDCKSRKYSALLPKVSIVIGFHNEAWSALMRTIRSAIDRSPIELLEEIILVDDASDFKYTYNPKNGQTLDMFVNESMEAVDLHSTKGDPRSPKPVRIRLLSSKERLGLVKTRLLGASKASAEVLVFLDSHCECNKGWLPPLLDKIIANKRTIACPVIDVVSHVDFSYVASQASNRGGFDWVLNFAWFDPSKISSMKQRTWTPVMAGGIFAVDKDYFHEVGTYDEHLSIWGMENIEMSLRVWMCGGRVEILSCSRVGHIFRAKNPTTFPEGTRKTILRNRARVAEVWLDEYKHFYFGSRLIEEVDIQEEEEEQTKLLEGLDERKELRRQLNCRGFRWFLENVFPGSKFPLEYDFLGQFELADSGKCLHVNHKSKDVKLEECMPQPGRFQLFAMTSSGQILQNGHHLTATSDSTWMAEHIQHKNPSIRWEKDIQQLKDGIKLRVSATPFCLTWNLKLHKLILNDCDVKFRNVWLMHHYPASNDSTLDLDATEDVDETETQVERPPMK